jgi:hypothetical protein
MANPYGGRGESVSSRVATVEIGAGPVLRNTLSRHSAKARSRPLAPCD